MLPNLHWMIIQLGPITIQVWGLFVALGIITGLAVARQFAQQRGLDSQLMVDLIFWSVLGGLVGGRIFFVVTEWSLFQGNLLDVVKIWQGGMSLSGGFIGAVVVAALYIKKKQLSFWPYVDTALYALPLGVGIGRLGCFFIFDHPGTVTDFFLGEVYYGDGLVRHNHGLYLVIDGLVLFGIFTLLRYKFKLSPPIYIVLYLIWEGVVRLWLDSFRILDSQWYGLRAAQWVGIIMIIIGVVVAVRTWRKRGRTDGLT
ncbi:MAG: prolipoprotein diacylglyceryl transferase [Candidatus Kerfeldbacteria bacterium]|nr:prolipoprotein diacylglyceryl transferase [Candidatus Kerfeldbacteria bacterium]